MLRLVLRRLSANRWLSLCLLAGVVAATALVSSIPMYTQGVPQRVFVKAMEEFQRSSGEYPGRYLVQTSLASRAAVEYKTIGAYDDYHQRLTRSMVPGLGIPLVAQARRLSASAVSVAPARPAEGEGNRVVSVDALEGLEEHARLLEGRMPSAELSADGVYEAAVTLGCYERQRLTLGEEYRALTLPGGDGEPLRLRVVGVFTVADRQDPYWYAGIGAYDSSLFIAFPLFLRNLLEGGLLPNVECEWFFALDYHSMTVAQLGHVGRALRAHTRLFDEYRLSYRIVALPLIRAYFERETALRLILGFLNVPILLLLAIYVYIVSHSIVENDRNEIAVWKSRGATTLQVFRIYATQSAILAASAMAAGPPLGLLLCGIIGASSGFMQFVHRTALPLSLSPTAYAYALAAALAFMASMLAPAVLASRFSIVEHKKRKARERASSRWRVLLDASLLGIAAYGYYLYRSRARVLSLTGAEGAALPLDPVLFLVCAAFVLGATLLYLRIHPLLVRLVFAAGRRVWSAAAYASLVHVSRSAGREAFFMLFFTAAIALGVFSSKSARTINQNMEERIRYALGADVTVLEDWGQAALAPEAPGAAGGSPASAELREPPYERFLRIPGPDAVTRVLRKPSVTFQSGSASDGTSLMGIVPHEFGEVAWLRSGLVPRETGAMLRRMSEVPWSALASRSLESNYGLARGDVLYVAWGEQGFVQLTIDGFFDFWPTYNPYARDRAARNLIVANLEHLRMQMPPEPYEVWIRMAPGAPTRELYEILGSADFRVLLVRNAGQEVVRQRNDALLQGTNGALTVGFMVTLAVCLIGFLLHSVLSYQGRILQFGVLRAMGVNRRSLVSMLVTEHLLTSGAAAAVGLAVGEIASALFVPLLSVVSSAALQVPPFRVTADPGDYARLLAVVLVALGAGITALAVMLRRLKVTQALKLGEE